MTNRIIPLREQLLDISKRKAELLTSVSENFDDIRDNPVFMEEIETLYLEMYDEEADLIKEKEITIPCPACGYECERIASFCMACGKRLHDDPVSQDM